VEVSRDNSGWLDAARVELAVSPERTPATRAAKAIAIRTRATHRLSAETAGIPAPGTAGGMGGSSANDLTETGVATSR
jgi:hypothetical protein